MCSDVCRVCFLLTGRNIKCKTNNIHNIYLYLCDHYFKMIPKFQFDLKTTQTDYSGVENDRLHDTLGGSFTEHQ